MGVGLYSSCIEPAVFPRWQRHNDILAGDVEACCLLLLLAIIQAEIMINLLLLLRMLARTCKRAACRHLWEL